MSLETFGLQAAEKPLVGKSCWAPNKSGTGSCHVLIIDQSPCGNFIQIKRDLKSSKPWWTKARDASDFVSPS